MGRKHRDTSKKRASILEAATQAFINEGYETCSMDRIAEVAGASKRTVYNHFPSKELLFQAVLESFIDEIMALKQIPFDPDHSLESQLARFADAKLEITRNPTWLGMMKVIAGVFISNPELVKEMTAQAQTQDKHLVTWLEKAHQAGLLHVPNPGIAAEVFWAMVGGAFFWPAIFMDACPEQNHLELRDEMIQVFLSRYRAQN